MDVLMPLITGASLGGVSVFFFMNRCRWQPDVGPLGQPILRCPGCGKTKSERRWRLKRV